MLLKNINNTAQHTIENNMFIFLSNSITDTILKSAPKIKINLFRA